MAHSLKSIQFNSLVLPGLKRSDAAPDQGDRHRADRKTKTKKQTENHSSDPQLVRACLGGDQAAWNELVERYQWLVYSVPRRYGLTGPDAEDVMQNVFVIVFRRLENLRDHTLLSSWLIRIAQHETFHHLRKNSKDDELVEELSDPQALPVDQVQRLEAQVAVHQALAQLDPQCRTLLEMFLSKTSPSYEEIASCVGCPIGSIGPTRARCFKKLEAVLRRMGVDLMV